MAPDDAGAMRKIPEHVRTEPGWALARLGDGGWRPAVERGLLEGSFDHEVVIGLADVLRMVGGQLRLAGAQRVVPLALGTLT